jgi:hypothetical protein
VYGDGNFFCLDARSYCLEQKADLLSMSTATIAEYIKTRLTRLRPSSWWIGLTDRDYPRMYYWTDTSPVNYIGWGSYSTYSMFLNFYNRYKPLPKANLLYTVCLTQ